MNNSADSENSSKVDDVSPTVAVIKAIEKREGTELSSQPPLYESIDPDALNQFLRSLESGRVSFTYLGYEVTVDHTMEVTVGPVQ